jgi:hypothetical protein
MRFFVVQVSLDGFRNLKFKWIEMNARWIEVYKESQCEVNTIGSMVQGTDSEFNSDGNEVENEQCSMEQ